MLGDPSGGARGAEVSAAVPWQLRSSQRARHTGRRSSARLTGASLSQHPDGTSQVPKGRPTAGAQEGGRGKPAAEASAVFHCLSIVSL